MKVACNFLTRDPQSIERLVETRLKHIKQLRETKGDRLDSCIAFKVQDSKANNVNKIAVLRKAVGDIGNPYEANFIYDMRGYNAKTIAVGLPKRGSYNILVVICNDKDDTTEQLEVSRYIESTLPNMKLTSIEVYQTKRHTCETALIYVNRDRWKEWTNGAE